MSGGFRVSDSTIETAAAAMHDAYENAATANGWETNPASRKPWADVPEANKATMRTAVAAAVPSLVAEIREQIASEMQTRVEYGQHAAGIGWLSEYRGIKYATHQRTVHFRVDEPIAIDHWTYADHRHPVEGCTHDRHDLTTQAVLDAAEVARGDAG